MTGYSVEMLKKCLEFAKAKPDGIINIPSSLNNDWGTKQMKSWEWLGWFRECLAEKINRNESKHGRKDNSEYRHEVWRSQQLLKRETRFYARDLHKDFHKRFNSRIIPDNVLVCEICGNEYALKHPFSSPCCPEFY